MRNFILILSLFLFTGLITAREPQVKTVTAKYDYVLHPKETPEEGKLRAFEKARIKAIAEEFGTALSQTNLTEIRKTNEESLTNFNSFSISDVNGEWIETISEDSKLTSENDMLIYRVTTKGRIRELINNRIDLDWALLTNGTDPKKNRLRNDTFLAGDYMYIYFMSPIEGYLSIYLADCDGENRIQCLIPYRGTVEGAMKIEPNKPYILFSRDNADESIKNKVGRIKLNTHNPIDFNQLYIIFSPNEYVKVVDTENNDPKAVIHDSQGNEIHLMPRQTDLEHFQRWLGKTRQKDPDMQVIHSIIKIEK